MPNLFGRDVRILLDEGRLLDTRQETVTAPETSPVYGIQGLIGRTLPRGGGTLSFRAPGVTQADIGSTVYVVDEVTVGVRPPPDALVHPIGVLVDIGPPDPDGTVSAAVELSAATPWPVEVNARVSLRDGDALTADRLMRYVEQETRRVVSEAFGAEFARPVVRPPARPPGSYAPMPKIPFSIRLPPEDEKPRPTVWERLSSDDDDF